MPTQFDPSQTAEQPFHGTAGSYPVQMMHRRGEFQLRVTSDYSVVDLPYSRSAWSMTVVLPAPGRSIDSLIASLSPASWDGMIGGLNPAGTGVYFPRFTLTYELHHAVTALRALGMADAFCGGAADFTLIVTTGACISDIRHKTFILVDETGTEAAAATGAVMPDMSPPPEIRIDRPFLLAIRERFSGTILFLGRIAQPTGAEN